MIFMALDEIRIR